MTFPSDKQAFARLKAARSAGNFPLLMQILAEQIETTSGTEKSEWLRMRSTYRASWGDPEQFKAAKADLAAAMSAAPEDTKTLVLPLMMEVGYTERLGILTSLPRSLRHAIRRDLYSHWPYWNNCGMLQFLRRRWCKSYLAYTKAIEVLAAMPEADRVNFAGWFVPFRATRARAALRFGRLRDAQRDIELAFEGMVGKPHMHPLQPYMARAELAFLNGDYAHARTDLQRIPGLVAPHPQMKILPAGHIQMHLLAAAIARAEGNAVGFEAFCGQALALARAHDLPLSEASVHAVLNGATL